MSDQFAEVKYRKHYIKEVVARVDLLAPLPEADQKLPDDLTNLVLQSFSIPEPREAVTREFKIGPQGSVKSGESEHFKEWRFHSKDRRKTLTITKLAIFVQYTSYETYEAIREIFLPILLKIGELFPGCQSSRIGLRYINSIELDEPNPTAWEQYLTPELLALFQFPPLDDRKALSRVFHNLEFTFDDYNLRCRLGMHNPDYPARIRRKVFVLDIDAYASAAVSLKEIGALLDRFHGTIQSYFERSIKDDLRGLMNG